MPNEKKDLMSVLDKEVKDSKDFDDFVGAVLKSIGTSLIAPMVKSFIKNKVEKQLKNIKFWS